MLSVACLSLCLATLKRGQCRSIVTSQYYYYYYLTEDHQYSLLQYEVEVLLIRVLLFSFFSISHHSQELPSAVSAVEVIHAPTMRFFQNRPTLSCQWFRRGCRGRSTRPSFILQRTNGGGTVRPFSHAST